MHFHNALTSVVDGKQLRRPSWGPKTCITRQGDSIVVLEGKKKVGNYTPDVSDVSALDWEFAKESTK